MMMWKKSFLKLFRQILRVLFLILASTQLTQADSSVVNFKITTNHLSQAIVDQYTNETGAFKSTVGTGSSNSASSDMRINKSIGLRVSFVKKYASISNFQFSSKLNLSFAQFGLSYPEGLGVFVERIDVNSNGLEIAPEFVLSNSVIDPNLDVNFGVGYSFIHSREKFRFGSWDINEKKNFGSPYGTVSIAYHHKPTDTFSFYFDTIFRSTCIDYSFGLKFPLSNS